jgi:hypothetical protein
MSDEVTRFDMSIEWGSMCGCDIVYVSDGDYVRYADYAALRAQLTTAERERDEARRERDAYKILSANNADVADTLRHRAERAEHRVRDLEVAVREWWDHGNDDQLWTEVFAADSPDDVEARLRALDAEAQP